VTQPFRLPSGGVIDRTRTLRFTFDGRAYEGYTGDTLASALLANGVHLCARSFKYHRPRGIHGAGAEEPNALVQLGVGARTEPNARATQIELHDGLVAASQNRWPSLRFDAGAVGGALSRLLPAGFYYKTFMWPPSPRGWLFYEQWIRRAAGMGRAAREPDPDGYAHRYAHCDVLVVGGGPAGLAAARAAAAHGARVVVCDEAPGFGGGLRGTAAQIDGREPAAWIAHVTDDLASRADVTLLPRTTAFGYYDQNLVGLVEHVVAGPGRPVPRQRVWHVRAQRVILAAGAHERGIAYPHNDLPGTLLASAARTYVERYAVRPGRRAVVFTNNDSAYAAALALRAGGVEIAAVVDARASAGQGALPQRARDAGLPTLPASAIVRAHGRMHVHAIDVAARRGGPARTIACDLVCVSGGWNPAVHLYSQARGRLRYDDALAAFVPHVAAQSIVAAGAANGALGLAAALAQGHAAGTAACEALGLRASPGVAPPRAEDVEYAPLEAFWSAASGRERAKAFVDLQDDVTVADIALAAREGYTSVEHLKRYTTLGMGTDQGKTGNVTGLALLAERLERPIAAVGTTTFRPPYTPVALGAMAGAAAGAHVEATRYSSLHEWHAAHGARFVTAGLWLRPHSYPRSGETPDAAANREARNVRTHAGLVDVSTLGKIELQGRDAAELLNRVYINRFDNLAIGRCRYGVMLRDDGIILDDGTTSRLGRRTT
jgi:sarcosine oxidase subunit alpha